jgi:dUTPase
MYSSTYSLPWLDGGDENEGSEALSVPPISVSRILTKPRDLSRAILPSNSWNWYLQVVTSKSPQFCRSRNSLEEIRTERSEAKSCLSVANPHSLVVVSVINKSFTGSCHISFTSSTSSHQISIRDGIALACLIISRILCTLSLLVVISRQALSRRRQTWPSPKTRRRSWNSSFMMVSNPKCSGSISQ